MEWGTGAGVPLVKERIRVGEAMSPPMIRKVRSSVNCDGTVIIDAPPGTSCPVITAMRGADYIVLVTEPTPFGLHDLQLAVGAVRILGIPCGLVINKSDIGDDQVWAYAQKDNCLFFWRSRLNGRLPKPIPAAECSPRRCPNGRSGSERCSGRSPLWSLKTKR